MKMRAAVFSVLMLMSPEGSAQPSKRAATFTPQQVDRILVLDRINQREDDTRRLAAVAYTVHNAQTLILNQADKYLLMKGVTPSGIFDRDTQIIVAGPHGTTYPLDQIAQRKASQLDGYSLRGSMVEKVADFSVDVGTLAAGRNYPLIAGAVKLLYPPIKDVSFRLVDRDPRAPNFEKDFTTEWSAWAYDQVRKGTPEGIALAPFVLKYQNVDPKKDNSNTDAVQKATERLALIKTSNTANEALEKIEDLSSAQSELIRGVENIQQQVASAAADAAEAANRRQALQDRVRPVQNIAGSLQLTSYLFTIAENTDAAKTVGGLANAAGGIANLMENAASTAPMVLASGYVGVALTVISTFKSSKEGPSPFPAIFDMLAAISKQIETLRHEVANGIAVLDAHLGAAVDALAVTGDATYYSVQQISLQIADLNRTFEDLNLSISQQLSTVSELILRAEDRNCFQLAGDNHLLILDRKNFIICRDTYVDRAIAYAASGASNSVPASAATDVLPPLALFPLGDDYGKLRNDIVGAKAEKSVPLANPSVWFRSTTLFLALIQSSPTYLQDVLEQQLLALIRAGEDLRRFGETIALTKNGDGSHLRQDRFNDLIDRIFLAQNSILDKVERQQKHASVAADPTQGLKQSPNIDHRYQMLATKGLKFCDKVFPILTSVQNISITRSGGCCGTDELINQNSIDKSTGPSQPGYRWGNLHTRIENEIKRVDYTPIGFDKSLLKAIDAPVVLMEQTRHQNAEMSYCISQFNLTHINMTHSTNNQIGLNLHLKVFLTTEGTSRNTTFLVQELAGAADLVTPFYFLYYDNTPRPNALIYGPWSQLQGKFDQFFKPVSNEEADKNRKIVVDEVDRFFGEQRGSLNQSILATIGHEKTEIERLQKQLAALTHIGLNANHAGVKKWLQALNSTYPTVDDLVSGVVLSGNSPDMVRQTIADARKKLKDSVALLDVYTDLTPDFSMITARVNDLEKLKFLNSNLSMATGNKTKRWAAPLVAR